MLRANAEALGRSLRWENEAMKLRQLIGLIRTPSQGTQRDAIGTALLHWLVQVKVLQHLG